MLLLSFLNKITMRKRIDRRAVCSSDNYEVTHKAHLEYLKEQHSNFTGIAVSGKIEAITVPRFKNIRIFGKVMKITLEEYNKYCKAYGIQSI